MKYGMPFLLSCLLAFAGCKDHSKPHKPIGVGNSFAPSDALDDTPGQVAPNPDIMSSAIKRSQLSDPEAIAEKVGKALADAPPYARGDIKGFEAHSDFVDSQLKRQLPPNGVHLMKLQCGIKGAGGQSFMEFHPTANRLEVHLPQLKRLVIDQIRDEISQLTQMLSDYYSQMLRLHDLNRDATTGQDKSKMLSAMLSDQISAQERNLGTDGSKFHFSPKFVLVATNTPFAALDSETNNSLLEAHLAFQRRLLGDGFNTPDGPLKKVRDFWANFPSSIAATSGWYGDVPLKEKPDDICLILKVRNIYPAVTRHGVLFTPLISIDADENDLRGDVVAWYVADKRSGRIIHEQLIGGPE